MGIETSNSLNSKSWHYMIKYTHTRSLLFVLSDVAPAVLEGVFTIRACACARIFINKEYIVEKLFFLKKVA